MIKLVANPFLFSPDVFYLFNIEFLFIKSGNLKFYIKSAIFETTLARN